MKLYSKKISDDLTNEYHLISPGFHFWGFLTIILMLAIIINSIEINPATIVYAIPMQIASTIFLFKGFIKRIRVWTNEEDY